MSRWRALGWQWLDDGLPWLVALLAVLALVVASQAVRTSGSLRPVHAPARVTPLAPRAVPSPNADRDPVS